MKKKKIYLSDLDDTLINDGDIIDDDLAEQLDDILKDQNIEFIISSARSFDSIKSRIKKLKTPIKIVSRSGAVLYDEKGKILFSIEIEKQEINKIVDFLIKEKLCPVIVSIENNCEKIFYISQYVNQQFYKKISGMDVRPIDYLEINKINHIIAIYCFGNISEGKKYNIINSKIRYYKDFIHITNANCNKGESIKFLKKKYPCEKIISFGNEENDFEMLNNSDDGYLVYKDEIKSNCIYKQIPFDHGKKIIEIMKGSEKDEGFNDSKWILS